MFQTGVGTAKADAVCRKVFASHPLDLAVSCGFACALTAADIGELLIGTDVIMYQATANPPAAGRVIPCAEHLTAAAVRAAPAAGLPARAGRFVTVPRVVWRAQDKREIAAGTGAVGLDMESAAVGAVAEILSKVEPAVVNITLAIWLMFMAVKAPPFPAASTEPPLIFTVC